MEKNNASQKTAGVKKHTKLGPQKVSLAAQCFCAQNYIKYPLNFLKKLCYNRVYLK